MKKIIVDIDNDGNVQISTKGFEGNVCLEETQFLKDLLGKETAVQLVAAYFATSHEDEKQFIPICG